MADNFQNNPIASSDPIPINESNNYGISDTSIFPQIEISDSLVVNVVRDILEQYRASSPYTRNQIKQYLGYSRRVITRIYSQ